MKSVFVVYLPSPTQHWVCQIYPFCCHEFPLWLYHHCFPFCYGVYGLFWGPQPTEHFWSMYQCWLSPLGSSILSYLSQQCSPSFPSTTWMVLQCFSLTSLPQCSPQEILVFLRYLYLLIVHIITRQPLLMFFWMIFHDFLPSFTPIPAWLLSSSLDSLHSCQLKLPPKHTIPFLPLCLFTCFSSSLKFSFPSSSFNFQIKFFLLWGLQEHSGSFHCSLLCVPWAHCAVLCYGTYSTVLWTSVRVRGQGIMSYSSLYAWERLMCKCCQNEGICLLGTSYGFPMPGEASQHSYLGYAPLPKLHQTFTWGVLQVDFPQKQTLRWRLTCRMFITECFRDQNLWKGKKKTEERLGRGNREAVMLSRWKN